jgi:hypothetical protein
MSSQHDISHQWVQLDGPGHFAYQNRWLHTELGGFLLNGC